MLGAVPVKSLQMKTVNTLNPGPIVRRRDPRQQLRVGIRRHHLYGGVDFQPGTARVIHQKQTGPIAAAQVAGGDVLPITGKIRHRQGGVIQQMQKARRAAAMLNIGPAGLRKGGQIEAVAGGNHRLLAGAEALTPALAMRRLPQLIAAHFMLDSHHVRRHGDIKKFCWHRSSRCVAA